MAAAAQRPNVILVLTDDQGYPDLGCHGNPWLHTPNLDAFHGEAVRCEDFHAQPLCTPTRGALMTGRRPIRNGAWATCWGRSILRSSELTMPQVFAAGGYRTGMFGKWHLGDNYPYRPFDRGFEHTVAHRGGGVGQTPDFWGNNYFDDTYFHNGRAQSHLGYCTDIWFQEAMRWIDSVRDEPFFAYIATNAPHSPYLVDEKYKARYAGNPDIVEPAFYGMIENIDENFGALRAFLAERGLEDNTLLIFMTDNGSSGAARLDPQGFVQRGYNAGMRGVKASYYDGGHRVPLFVRWPNGGLAGGRDVTEMALDVDLLPTFVELCGLPTPEGGELDGTSIAALLAGRAPALPGDRIHILQQRQSTDPPEKWSNCVMTRRWRLVHGRELYDIQADPGQKADIAAEHPDVVARLREAHEAWWAEVAPGLGEYSHITIGSDAENPSRLDAMDVMGDVAWHQTQIIQAQKSTGRWAVNVDRPGRYRFALRRWPEELGLPIDAGIAPDAARRHIYAPEDGRCVTIQPTSARLRLFAREMTRIVRPGEKDVTFEMDVPATGETVLEAWFADGAGDERGAFYVYIERM